MYSFVFTEIWIYKNACIYRGKNICVHMVQSTVLGTLIASKIIDIKVYVHIYIYIFLNLFICTLAPITEKLLWKPI